MTEGELKNIWSVPKYLPYVQPELTDEILESAEKQIGFKLPKELIEILKIQNGGYLRYRLPETPHEQIMGIGPYFPSLTDLDWTDYKEYVSFELDGLVPIDGDGHWYICLDYRNSKEEPKVSWIDLECDNQEDIADSFADFLGLLELDINNELVIETENSIGFSAEQIENILHIKFEDPEFYNYGYANYRSTYKGSWVWLTPNKVPSGFVRENDNRYDELKSKMLSTSLRYPKIPENYLFISVSDDKIREELFEELAGNSIKMRPLKDFVQADPNY